MTVSHPAAKLPVPPLSSTTAQLLTALQPLIPSQVIYDELQAATVNFLHSQTANVLQKHLHAISEREECYLNDSRYISNTTPGIYGKLRGDTLPRNPFLLLEKDPLSFTIKNDQPISQSERAASLVFLAIKFVGAVRDDALDGDVTRTSGVPLEMESYKSMFNSCRVPNHDNREIGIALFDNNAARHIVIVCNNHYWKLNVFSPTTAESPDRQHVYYTEAELCAIFKQVLALSEEQVMGIGSVTTETRKEWGHLIPALTEQAPKAMQSINLALFLLVLDAASPETDAEKLVTIPHGTSEIVDGVQRGSCTSRWYDKLQLVVCANAAAGLIWENTSMDGNCVLRFIGDVYTDGIIRLAKKINGSEYSLFPAIPIASIPDDEGLVRLRFNIKNELSYMVHLSETRLADLIHQHTFHSMELNVQSVTHIFKYFGISLDSLVQVAVQLAHYALYGKLVNSLEPISTRKFKGSRNELIAVQSLVVEACARAFISKDVLSAEKWALFAKACAQHKLSYKNAINGHGWERHYNALKALYLNRSAINSNPETARDMRIPLLDPQMEEFFFGNEVLAKISEPEIIIANCGNPAIKLFGISPAVANGFGIGYIIKASSLSISLVGTSQWRQTDRLFDTVKWVVLCVKGLSREAFALQASEPHTLYGMTSIGSRSAVAMTSVQSDTTARLVELSRMHAVDASIVSPPVALSEGQSETDAASSSMQATGVEAGAVSHPSEYLNHEIALSARDMHRDNTTASSHDQQNQYILGGYGFFDGGDLDYLKTDSFSRLQSATQSRLQSRSGSSLNLYQLSLNARLASRSRSRTPYSQPTTAGLDEDPEGAHHAFLKQVLERVQQLEQHRARGT